MATLVDPFKYSTCPRCGGGLLTESFLVASETGWTSLGPDRLRSTDLGEALEASAGLFAGRTIPAGLPILVCPNCVKELAEQAVVSDLMNAQGLSEAEARELAPYLSRIRSGNVSISRQQTPAVAPRGGDTALHTLVQRIHFRSPRALIEWEAAFAKIVRLCETGVSVHALNAKGATALWALLDIDDFRLHESEYLFDEIGWYGDDRDFAGRVFDWRRVFETRTRYQTPNFRARFSVLICYEDIFPDLVREFCRRGPDFLVNMTNDAWFGKTSAPYQHAQASVFRAVENRIPVIRATNTGYSCFISPEGRILGQVEDKGESIFVTGHAGHDLVLRKGRSLYTRFGDVFLGGVFILCIFAYRSRNRHTPYYRPS